jgi:hypothetical protein
MRQHDGQRHEFGGLVACISEHKTLIACTTGIHAHGDVGGLALNSIQDAASFAIKPVRRVGVPHLFDRLPGDARNVNITRGRDFAGYHANAGSDQHFASNASERILFEDCVKNCVGNLIRNLVGVALCY